MATRIQHRPHPRIPRARPEADLRVSMAVQMSPIKWNEALPISADNYDNSFGEFARMHVCAPTHSPHTHNPPTGEFDAVVAHLFDEWKQVVN